MKICVIGLGYVGLPLAVEFAKKFEVIGFDISELRINELKSGHDRTREVESQDLKNSKLKYSNKLEEIKTCNIYIVTVPTPIDGHNHPDLTPILKASETVGKILKRAILLFMNQPFTQVVQRKTAFLF
jgi:UDP-N-acetyl-D-galactosamine dehydrogenase